MKKYYYSIAIGLAGVMLGHSALANPYVLLSNNSRIDGTAIRAKSDGEIILTTAQGQRSFFKGQYLKAVADKPAEIDQAKAAIDAKQYDQAISMLNDVAQRYQFLEWDNVARALSAKASGLKGDYAAAVSTYDQIFRINPNVASDPAYLWPYCDALLGAKQYDKLTLKLNDVIAKGNRADAAKAQTVRGDIKMAQGQAEGAAIDYLRTVILFESEKDAQPEALFKAGEALEQLRDPRAKQMFQRVMQEYPGTPYAQKATAKK